MHALINPMVGNLSTILNHCIVHYNTLKFYLSVISQSSWKICINIICLSKIQIGQNVLLPPTQLLIFTSWGLTVYISCMCFYKFTIYRGEFIILDTCTDIHVHTRSPQRSTLNFNNLKVGFFPGLCRPYCANPILNMKELESSFSWSMAVRMISL